MKLATGVINHPIATIVDREEPAHVFLHALADMSCEDAAGIVSQIITCTAAELRELQGPHG
jgi:hypothetical protein